MRPIKAAAIGAVLFANLVAPAFAEPTVNVRVVIERVRNAATFGAAPDYYASVFAGQNGGIKEVEEKVWLISFMHYGLGFFDHESNRFECADNPFAAQVLPMSSV